MCVWEMNNKHMWAHFMIAPSGFFTDEASICSFSEGGGEKKKKKKYLAAKTRRLDLQQQVAKH